MEPATADPSLLTDTATSDTTDSVGSVGGVETAGLVLFESVIGAVELVVSVGPVLVGSVGGVVVLMAIHYYC